MLDAVLDVVGAAALLLGLLIATIGLYGMLRRERVFEQLHAAGTVTGPAVVLILVGSVASGSADIITSAALVMLFVFITSPLSAHAIAQAAWRREQDADDPRAP